MASGNVAHSVLWEIHEEMGRPVEAVRVGDREEIRESLKNLESLGE